MGGCRGNFLWWVEGNRQESSRHEGCSTWVEKEFFVLDHLRRLTVHGFCDRMQGLQLWPNEEGRKRSQPKDQHVEQSLGARSDVLREVLVHEDVERREEESVANAVEDLHG